MIQLEKVKELLQPILDLYRAELIEVNIGNDKYKPTLRVLIDKENGITLQECSDINRQLGDMLDKDEAIKESYLLEVSSPGIDRALATKRDFEKVIAKKINLNTKKPIDGRSFFHATVDSVDADCIKLKLKDKHIVVIPYENIHKATLDIKF